jgi:hypothetical protein
MHFGIVAVKAEVAHFIEAFTTAWPRHEPSARVSLAGLEALDAWIRATQRAVYAANWSVGDPGTDAFGFWQDGEWAVMLDPSYVQASDGQALAMLSERFGRVLSFVVETSGGCAFFDAYERGRRIRRIQAIDGEVKAEGERLPQEAQLPESRYDIEETDQLQRAFGITPLQRLPGDVRVEGVAFIDRTERPVRKKRESKAKDAAATVPTRASPAPKKPWWRFW